MAINETKEAGSNYQYNGPANLKETKKNAKLEEEVVINKAKGLSIEDKLLQISENEEEYPKKMEPKAPPIDAPELPHPTGKAKLKMAVLEQIKKNSWVMNPSYMGAFIANFFEYLKMLGNTRAVDEQTKMISERSAFELQKENAHLAKLMKDTAAQKELIKAVGSFVNAGIKTFQLTSMVASKGRVEKEVKKEYKSKIDKQKDKIDRLNNTGKQVTDANGNVKNVLSPKNTKALDKAKNELQTLKHERQRELQTRRSEAHEESRTKGEIFNHISEGVIGVLSGIYTQQEGLQEKQRGINEAILKIFNILEEGAKKEIDNMQSQFDKIIQQIIQTHQTQAQSHHLSSH